MLTACYDLARSPTSYDIVSFLLYAEAERIRRGEESLHIVILPGPNGGFRQDNLWPKSLETRANLLRDIVVPMCKLLPSCVSVDVLEQRPSESELAPQIGFGPPLHMFDRFVRSIAQSGRPLRAKGEIHPNPKLVTITLRESEHWPERNSNVKQWLQAARELVARGYHIVFVRDTIRYNEPIEEFPVNAQAACELHARATLYASALCNMFVSNGPAWFAIAMNAPALIFRPTTENLHRVFSEEFLAQCGLRKGQQLADSPTHQRIVWQDDDASTILQAFEAFSAVRLAA